MVANVFNAVTHECVDSFEDNGDGSWALVEWLAFKGYFANAGGFYIKVYA